MCAEVIMDQGESSEDSSIRLEDQLTQANVRYRADIGYEAASADEVDAIAVSDLQCARTWNVLFGGKEES